MNLKIYTLSCPETNMVRYIGLTKYPLEKRLNGHITSSNNSSSRSSWIQGLKSKGLKPIIEELDEAPSEYCMLIEDYWINQFKAWGFNLTNGNFTVKKVACYRNKQHKIKLKTKPHRQIFTIFSGMPIVERHLMLRRVNISDDKYSYFKDQKIIGLTDYNNLIKELKNYASISRNNTTKHS